MGAKYTTQTISGYNSSPPPDDGSQVASNLITWAAQKTKLADPIKTLAESENTALVSAFDYSVRQITASDNTVASDHMRCVEIAPTVTIAVTVSLGDAATMTNVYRVYIKNSSARNQTLGRVTGGDTIDGTAGNVTLTPGEGRIVQTNNAATGYVTVSKHGPFVDSDAVIVGSADGTKKARFEVDGLTTATTRVYTLQDSDDTLVGRATTDTLTNKSLTSPTVTGTMNLSGGQISFPAAQSASADANTLDDYEEGTWTPNDASAAALTFSSVNGYYTKIGRLVFITATLTYPATGDASAARIGNLPFTVANATGNVPVGNAFASSAATAPDVIDGLLNTITAEFRLHNGTTVTNGNLSGATVRFSLVYHT